MKDNTFPFVLGVDISKEWFDYCLMDQEFNIIQQGQINNVPDQILVFIQQLQQQVLFDQVLLCMEHTGIYINHLYKAWLAKGGYLSVVHANKISEHLAGKVRWEEKNDQLDAQRIAQYAHRFADKIRLYQLSRPILDKLQALQRLRDRLIRAIKLLEVPLKELAAFASLDISQSVDLNQQASIKSLKQDLKRVERHMEQLIDQDKELSLLFKLITSVQGVGPVTAREIIIATKAFSTFNPQQAKAFAKYAGVVPKERSSGKSVRKRKTTAGRCHKRIKSLLTLGASSLIKSKSDLGQYYQRKTAQGKHHLSVINAMRNKLILRIFAVVKNQVMYEKNLNYSLV